jgi:hypothetical protein
MVYQKRWEPKRRKFYYYHQVTGVSVWDKPLSLGDADLEVLDRWVEVPGGDGCGGPLYFHPARGQGSFLNEEIALGMMQRMVRRYQSRYTRLDLPQVIEAANATNNAENFYR